MKGIGQRITGGEVGRKGSLNWMLKPVHDTRVWSFFCHPELASGSQFWVRRISVLKIPPGGGLYSRLLIQDISRWVYRNAVHLYFVMKVGTC